jgi:hypothetical protein
LPSFQKFSNAFGASMYSGCFIMGLLIAYLLGIITGIKNPPQQSVRSVGPDREVSNETTGADTFAPLSSRVPPSKKSDEETCRCCYHKTPRWKLLLDVGTFLALLAYAGTTLFIFCQMRQQTGIFQKTVNDTDANFMLDQRPWVGVIKIDVTVPAPSLPYLIQIAVSNSGKTPALRVRTAWEIECEPIKKNPQLIYTQSDANDAGIVLPNSVVTLQSEKSNLCSFPNRMLLQSGKARLYMIGTIWYDDEFKKPHQTDFCYYTQMPEAEVGKIGQNPTQSVTANMYTSPCPKDQDHNSAN